MQYGVMLSTVNILKQHLVKVLISATKIYIFE